MSAPPPLPAVDAFDLPDWVALDDVTWASESGLGAGHHVRGALTSAAAPDRVLACDVVAVDDAYPVPVTDEATRATVHAAWHHGQVHLARHEERLALAIPGRVVDLDRTLEALRRLTLAVGGSTDRFAVLLRL